MGLREHFRRLQERRRVKRLIRAVRESGLFDAEFYLDCYADVAQTDLDPLLHYVLYGRKERRQPSADFLPALYLHFNADVAKGGYEPLAHFIRRGRKEGRTGHSLKQLLEKFGLFDPSFYKRSNPDVVLAGLDPLKHYLSRGRNEGRQPSPDFSPKLYLEANEDVRAAAKEPVFHVLTSGKSEGRLGHSLSQALLDTGLWRQDYYVARYPDVAASGMDALQHFLEYGWAGGRSPSPDFDPDVYVTKYPEVLQHQLDPLLHFIRCGRSEGRYGGDGHVTAANLDSVISTLRNSGLFDPSFYLKSCPYIRSAGIDPLWHYLFGGHAWYVDPSPNFSVSAYTRAHPEIEWRRQNPLLHRIGFFSDQVSELDLSADQARAHAIRHQAHSGASYATRFGFALQSAQEVGPFGKDALAELVSRKPRMLVDPLSPDVTIIIPVYGQLHFVLNCLDSLGNHESRYSVEIIVADDASPAQTGTEALAAIPWIRYIRQAQNLGFLDNCNNTAESARGRILVFLNSDTRVADGWLDELISSFDLFPRAGLVGSKLFHEDVTLQEAGGIYWKDGSAWNYGSGDDPFHPKYSFARRVDYVSGASIAVPRSVWQEMNGFDTLYRPAYCEDADLAFRLRAAGYEVWFQAASQLIHYEGKTHGKDLTRGVKAYQVENLKKLAKRWAAELAKHRATGQDADREANRLTTNRILVLDEVTPAPDRDSGSFMTVKMIQGLQALGYQVTFFPQFKNSHDHLYTVALQRTGVECLYQPYMNEISDVLRYRADFDVVLAYRHHVLSPAYPAIRESIPTAPIIFHNVDLHFWREQREADLNGSQAKRIKAELTRAAELELIAKCDCTIVHTKAELALIQKDLPVDNIVEFPYVAEIQQTTNPFDSRRDIMFLGGFTHRPNIDAVTYFVESIWPGIVSRLPEDARFVIVGAFATAEVLALERSRVTVMGYVPDLKPHFDAARVFVAPLRYGAGINGKVIQALCHGVPSVVTSIAAEGIGLVSGKETLIADTPEEFADAVISLFFDEARWSAMQTAGLNFAASNFSWDRCLELCREVLETAEKTWISRKRRTVEKRLAGLLSGDATSMSG